MRDFKHIINYLKTRKARYAAFKEVNKRRKKIMEGKEIQKKEIPERAIKYIQEFCSRPDIFDKLVKYKEEQMLKEVQKGA